MIDNPYKVLGLEEGASEEDVKKAYRRMARVYHPDLHPDDPEANQKMNEINEAYDALTNPEKYAARRAMKEAQEDGNWETVSDYGMEQMAIARPTVLEEDSAEIRQVVDYINAGQAQNATDILTQIPSTGRNARWYYLSALAHYVDDRYVQAAEQMERAVHLEPTNRMYQQLVLQFRRVGQVQEKGAGGFVFNFKTMIYIFFGCFFLRLLLDSFL